MTGRLPWLSLKLAVAAIFVVMLGPILITASVAFNATDRSYFPPRGFSLPESTYFGNADCLGLLPGPAAENG